MYKNTCTGRRPSEINWFSFAPHRPASGIGIHVTARAFNIPPPITSKEQPKNILRQDSALPKINSSKKNQYWLQNKSFSCYSLNFHLCCICAGYDSRGGQGWGWSYYQGGVHKDAAEEGLSGTGVERFSICVILATEKEILSLNNKTLLVYWS